VACAPPGAGTSGPAAAPAAASMPGATGLCVPSGADWADPPGTVLLPEDNLRAIHARTAFPRYPIELRNAGTEGNVVVTFVVDTAGRVDGRSARITASTHAGFSAAVCEAVPHLRFGRADGRPLLSPVRTSMPFTFSITR
jgi:TonB family protein